MRPNRQKARPSSLAVKGHFFFILFFNFLFLCYSFILYRSLALPSKFGDDDRFKIYKVFKKNLSAGLRLIRCKGASCFPRSRGRQKTSAEMKTTAKGKVRGEAARKALDEALDPLVATLSKKETGKEKATKTPKPKDPAELAQKELSKDIKASFGLMMLGLKHKLRLRDKAGKAMEFAGEIRSLGIPHQEARPEHSLN